ncbi:DUF6578 domain-containing protein [Actinokineospora sp. HUAS TT18]|uniref:DUF6578 domain-containing protein n=1 Tax=Actinokineospora sp. HUAS TT18 TaxID=3447451 RepID=UPI003F51F442
MAIQVFYEAWQMECCGDPFQVGDTVAWTLTPADLPFDLGELVGAEVAEPEFSEEHHDGAEPGTPVTRGVVTFIQALTSRVEVDPRTRSAHRIPGTGRLTPVRWADGTEVGDAAESFDGYLVEIDPFP